jgi:hypothetical protein
MIYHTKVHTSRPSFSVSLFTLPIRKLNDTFINKREVSWQTGLEPLLYKTTNMARISSPTGDSDRRERNDLLRQMITFSIQVQTTDAWQRWFIPW